MMLHIIRGFALIEVIIGIAVVILFCCTLGRFSHAMGWLDYPVRNPADQLIEAEPDYHKEDLARWDADFERLVGRRPFPTANNDIQEMIARQKQLQHMLQGVNLSGYQRGLHGTPGKIIPSRQSSWLADLLSGRSRLS